MSSDPQPEGISALRATIFASAVATVGVLPVFMTGGLAVQMADDLGFSDGKLGLAVGAYFGTSALASAPLGRLAQRLGFTRSLHAASAISLTSLIGIALSPSLLVLCLFLVIAGLANSIGQPAANGLIVTLVPQRRRALAFAAKQSAIPLSTLLGGLAVPTLALTVGWRWAFVAGACLAIVILLSRTGQGRMAGSATAGSHIVNIVPLIVLGGSAAFAAASANALGSFVTASAVDTGFGEATAGWIQVGGSAVGLAMRMFMGWLTDRSSSRDFSVVVTLMATGVFGFAFLGAGNMMLFVIGVTIGYGAGWAWPGIFNDAVSQRHLTAAAAATGITQSGVYVGGAVGPLLFGFVVEHHSYEAAWMMAAVSGAIAATGVHIGRRMLEARLQAEPG